MAFIPTVALKKIMDIPRKEKLEEEDRKRRQDFIWGTMIGSEWECKAWQDFIQFNGKFRPRWAKLYERFRDKEEKEWACFDKPGLLEFIVKEDLVTKNLGVLKQTTVTESFTFPNEYAGPIDVPPSNASAE
jgi:hypothetical protein